MGRAISGKVASFLSGARSGSVADLCGTTNHPERICAEFKILDQTFCTKNERVLRDERYRERLAGRAGQFTGDKDGLE
jgi:hypothetical protein